MPLSPFSTGENRLTHFSSRSIREEALAAQQAREKALRASQPFATPTVDLKTRTVTSPAGVNPNAVAIQEGIKTNFDYDAATQAERDEQARLTNLADSTGQQRVTATPTPSSLTTGARGIAGATGDTTASRDTLGVIDTTALNRLTTASKDGTTAPLTDEQARAKITADRPTVAQTMSNTGRQAIDVLGRLGVSVTGTIDGRASVNVTQDNLDALSAAGLVSAVGGQKPDGTYIVELNIGDRELSDQYAKRKQEMDQSNANIRELQRRQAEKDAAIKTANDKAREGSKDFTSYDTSAFDQTKSQIEGILASISNLTPEVQAAVIPGLISLQQSNNDIANTAKQMAATLPTDAEIEARYKPEEDWIKEERAKYEAFMAKNQEHSLEVVKYNKEALEAEKAIIDHNATVSEQKQMQVNIENEQRLRRQLNKLGLNTDLQGLKFLNSEIQKGVDTLENLKTANNLVSLKAQLAIGKGYALDVKGIMNDYEGKYLEISSQTTKALMDVKNSISKSKSDRDKTLREILKDSLEKKDANDKEARGMILSANFKMMDEVSKQKTLEAQKEKDAITQIEYLSKNFEPADVADQIKELSKNITSFDASGLAGKTPISVQLALKKLGKGTQGNGSFPSMPTVPRAPLITPQSFLDEKLKEYEAEISTSLTPEARKKWLDANKANIAAEYASKSGTPAGAIESSGDARIDETAQLVYSGTIPSVKEAAKQTGLSYVAIARQVERLQQNGVSGGFVRMNDQQQKAYTKLSSELSKDPTTQFARQVPYKVSVIKASLAEKNGLSDIAAINNFQSGLVDPGATVREGDVALISKQAIAFVQKVKAETWYKKGTEGSIMPEATRQQMLGLIDKMQKASVEAYRQGPYARIISDGKALGVPAQNMLHWGNVEYDDPDFSSSTDQETSPETDSELDSLLTTYGY